MEIEKVIYREQESESLEGNPMSSAPEQDLRQRIDDYEPEYFEEVRKGIDAFFKKSPHVENLIELAKLVGITRDEVMDRFRDEHLSGESMPVRQAITSRLGEYQDAYLRELQNLEFEGWVFEEDDRFEGGLTPAAYVREVVDRIREENL